MKIQNRHLTITLVWALILVLLEPTACAAILSATPENIAGSTLVGVPPKSASPTGVSPEVFHDEQSGTYYLYTTSMPPKTYRSSDGENWTEVSDATLPQGFDWSIIESSPGSYRLYYAAINPNLPATVKCSSSRKQLFVAESSDLLHWSNPTGPLLDDVGCGVPHVMKKKDGKYLLYFNTITSAHGIHIATSDDGLNWVVQNGLVANETDLVDPAPLEMPDGTFLMVSSTTGRAGTQQLRILSSPDGLTWSLREKPLYAPSGFSVLDPSLKLINDSLRVWFGYTPGNDHGQSRIGSGALTLAPEEDKLIRFTLSNTNIKVGEILTVMWTIKNVEPNGKIMLRHSNGISGFKTLKTINAKKALSGQMNWRPTRKQANYAGFIQVCGKFPKNTLPICTDPRSIDISP